MFYEPNRQDYIKIPMIKFKIYWNMCRILRKETQYADIKKRKIALKPTNIIIIRVILSRRLAERSPTKASVDSCLQIF